MKTAAIYWVRNGAKVSRGEDLIAFPITGDGEFHRYIVKLSESKSYVGAMIQLRLDPVSAGREGDWVKIRSIALTKTSPE